MKKIWKKGIAVLITAVMVLGFAMSAYGEEVQGTLEDEEITIDEGDKPFLSLGADLKTGDRAEVLRLLGLSEEDLDDYDVIEVTNAEEHEYLGEYIPADKIGTRALSSVVVMEGKRGSGIKVTTKNINYCTAGMYENALATAGVKDAEVIVAGPFEISGTAALLGAIKAYSVMTGDKIEEDVIDGAINEIVTTGELEEAIGDSEEIEGMVAYLKEQIANSDMTDDEMRGAIEEAADKFDVSLTQDQIDQLMELLKKLKDLDLDWDNIIDQAQGLYEKLKGLGINVDSDEIAKQAEGFFGKLINFFKSLFSR